MHPKLSRYIKKEYEAWIRKHPCMVCGGLSECHHVYHAKKNSYLAAPLCHDHHVAGGDSYHRLGHQTFSDKHGINLEWEIINLLTEYIEERNLE